MSPRPSLKYRLGLFSVFILAFGLLYQLPNAFPIFTPQQLPLSWLDNLVPFSPWTFFIYLSDYPMAVAVIFLIPTLDLFHSYGRVAFTCLGLSAVFFILMPTTYPRPIYDGLDPWAIRFMVNLVHGADNPTNCFPSMHVAITGAAAYAMRFQSRRVYALYWIWAGLIFASTLTTKQHYAADIWGGMIVTAIAISFDQRWMAAQAKKIEPTSDLKQTG